MNRRDAVLALIALAAAPLASEAQRPAKVYRIGYLGMTPPTPRDPVWEAFVQGLRERGYVEGQNLVIERRFAEGKIERLPEAAAELVALRVDLIFTAGGTPAARSAKNATATIPIVIGAAGDPVRSGLIASLARPGGNVTGMSIAGFDLGIKRLDLLKQTVPKATRAGYLFESGVHGRDVEVAFLKQLAAAAQSLGLTLHLFEVKNADDFEAAFAAMVRAQVEILLIYNSVLFNTHAGRLAELAARHRLPAIAEEKAFGSAGGLLVYGVDYADLFRRATIHVDRILKGARPVDLPVEEPTKFELVINLKTATALGITIPQSVLLRADRVID